MSASSLNQCSSPSPYSGATSQIVTNFRKDYSKTDLINSGSCEKFIDAVAKVSKRNKDAAGQILNNAIKIVKNSNPEIVEKIERAAASMGLLVDQQSHTISSLEERVKSAINDTLSTKKYRIDSERFLEGLLINLNKRETKYEALKMNDDVFVIILNCFGDEFPNLSLDMIYNCHRYIYGYRAVSNALGNSKQFASMLSFLEKCPLRDEFIVFCINKERSTRIHPLNMLRFQGLQHSGLHVGISEYTQRLSHPEVLDELRRTHFNISPIFEQVAELLCGVKLSYNDKLVFLEALKVANGDVVLRMAAVLFTKAEIQNDSDLRAMLQDCLVPYRESNASAGPDALIVQYMDYLLSNPSEAMLEKDGEMWECIGLKGDVDSGYLCTYHMREEFNIQRIDIGDRESSIKQHVESTNKDLFPAVEPPNMDRPIRKVIDNIDTKILQILGYSFQLIDGEQFMVLPDAKALRNNWKALRDYLGERIPEELRVYESHGVAALEEFNRAFYEYDVLISDGRELVHDNLLHVLPAIYLIVRDSKLYETQIDSLRDLHRQESQILDAVDESSLSSKERVLLQMLKTTTGIVVDFFTSLENRQPWLDLYAKPEGFVHGIWGATRVSPLFRGAYGKIVGDLELGKLVLEDPAYSFDALLKFRKKIAAKQS